MEDQGSADAVRFKISRRDFLKFAGFAYMGVFASGCHERGKGMTTSLPGFSGSHEPVVMAAIPRGADAESVLAAIGQTAEAATNFSWLSRGDTVFIKVVSNSANPYPATTSPLSVSGMVRLLKKKGAGRVIVGDKPGVQAVYQDGDGQKGSSRDVLVQNGLQQAALESGAQVHYFEEPGFDAFFGDRTEHRGHWKGELLFPNILNHVDHIVLLPRVSRHALAGTTLGLKAAVGWLRDDSRLELHHDAATFYEKIAEINDAVVLRQKLRLVLNVATKVQTTFGPDQGFSAQPDPGLVFASESLLAHDMVSLGWLLWNREHGTPPAQLRWFRDPYITYPGMMNRIFVGMIWGMGSFFTAGTYTHIPLRSVRTDPVISRAAVLWGGFPRLELVDVNRTLPEDIARYLKEKAADPELHKGLT
ncbi:MAG: DUF362 domain-containing protein [Thermodesulfobacteriota bacterium]